jgi:hypothetical protein
MRAILSSHDRVLRVESVHTHRFGPYFMANVTIAIDGALSVSRATGSRMRSRRCFMTGSIYSKGCISLPSAQAADTEKA